VMNVNVDCATCGVVFCLTDVLYRRRKRDGDRFYCPNGHVNVYRPTPDQQRIAELECKLKTEERLSADWRDRWDEIYAQREELLAEVKQCPGRCGWKSTRRIPRDPVAMGRGLERVRIDVANHLVDVHGAQPAMAERRLLEAGS
jgi:hypothetical protein